MSDRHPGERENVDRQTILGFGEEWEAFDQTDLTGAEYDRLFDGYFAIFPFATLPPRAEGFDLGCGSGRWAARIAERVGRLHCIDPSPKALAVTQRRLGHRDNVDFDLATAGSMQLAQGSQDFGYSLGVLHHVPDTARALADCVAKLKPSAPFLLYLYYDLEDRPRWFRFIWRCSDALRKVIARLPFPLRKGVASAIAAGVYWPFARLAWLAEKAGIDIADFPLGAYRYRSFYSMRTDALDRFGTRLEQRFSRGEIERMMAAAGLIDIEFSDDPPFWVACGRKASHGAPGHTERPEAIEGAC